MNAQLVALCVTCIVTVIGAAWYLAQHLTRVEEAVKRVGEELVTLREKQDVETSDRHALAERVAKIEVKVNQ